MRLQYCPSLQLEVQRLKGACGSSHHAGLFTGDDGPVEVGTAQNLDMVNSSFTALGWVKIDSDQDEGDCCIFTGVKHDVLISGGEPAMTKKILHLLVRGGRFYLGMGWNDSSDDFYRCHHWEHVVFIVEAQTIGCKYAVVTNGHCVS